MSLINGLFSLDGFDLDLDFIVIVFPQRMPLEVGGASRKTARAVELFLEHFFDLAGFLLDFAS
jgi:hypothetical protein